MYADLLIRIAHERQDREREIQRLRRLDRSERQLHLRRRLGESFIRLGERLARPDPAWSR